jgi:hypothetical protein
MTATQEDVVIEQGTTFTYLWQILDVDLVTLGGTCAAKFRLSHASGTTVLALASPGTLTIAKSGNHTHVTANVTATATAALTAPQRGVYDLEYTVGAAVTRAVEGSFYVTPEATK